MPKLPVKEKKLRLFFKAQTNKRKKEGDRRPYEKDTTRRNNTQGARGHILQGSKVCGKNLIWNCLKYRV